MHTTAEIRVEALSGKTSMQAVVDGAISVLKEAELSFETHDLGTNVQGEMADVLACVEKIHARLHAQGIERLSTHLRLGTRIEGSA